jgi:hypothetical protein
VAGEQRLPFELVEANEYGRGERLYESPEPGLSVLTTRDALGDLPAAISAEAEQRLGETDFDTYVVVAVFQGYRYYDGYGVEVERIERRETSIILYSRFVEPIPGQQLHPLVTSPYAIVEVEKVGSFGNVFDFVLNVGGEAVASASHFVP